MYTAILPKQETRTHNTQKTYTHSTYKNTHKHTHTRHTSWGFHKAMIQQHYHLTDATFNGFFPWLVTIIWFPTSTVPSTLHARDCAHSLEVSPWLQCIAHESTQGKGPGCVWWELNPRVVSIQIYLCEECKAFPHWHPVQITSANNHLCWIHRTKTQYCWLRIRQIPPWNVFLCKLAIPGMTFI